MRKVWIIVANQSEATILQAENVQTLLPVTKLLHTEGHQYPHDLVSDKQGSYRGCYGSNSCEPRTPVKVKEAESFAQQIANYVEQAMQHQQLDRIYLVAKPPFVHDLRTSFSRAVSQLIADEIHKDIVHATPSEIRSYLPAVL